MSNSNRNPNNNLQESGINNNIIINLNLQEFQGIIDTNVGELVLQEPQGVINNDIGELVLCEPQIIDNSIPELVLQKIPEITNPIIYEP
ncbi:MAG TPA: hypothetical protein LFV66_02215 [Rickettsia endosymbiont of Bembidion lapponicum]|nr:hypothetical protein [Rickettsia endosymbiont of Bembidion lapponicum]